VSNSEKSLSIGEVAKRAGVNASAIRYYERHGLLPAPARVGGKRRYEGDVEQRLEVIGLAKQAGFSLAEIKLLLEANDSGSPIHDQLHDLARRKLPEIDALIERAQAIRRWLQAADACTCDTLDACGLFEPGARLLSPRP
jgi:MerR family redox-sensitive transcriptional activator SoxR